VDPRRAVADGDAATLLDLRSRSDLPYRGDPYATMPSGTTGPVGGWRKRAVDIFIASAVLITLAPITCFIALWIKFTMGGPVIFTHRRVGHNGRVFGCLKFRTMVSNSDEILNRYLASNPSAAREWAQTRKLRSDPRVTTLGDLLRKSSLDELPQLFNVLRGDMSCVGPRPILAEELDNYGIFVHEYLRSRPGVTGLWQVSGRSDLDYSDRVQLDARYVREWRLWSDFVILFKTIPAVLSFRGSC
jgi:exopolysaccharide production protein ExoY